MNIWGKLCSLCTNDKIYHFIHGKYTAYLTVINIIWWEWKNRRYNISHVTTLTLYLRTLTNFPTFCNNEKTKIMYISTNVKWIRNRNLSQSGQWISYQLLFVAKREDTAGPHNQFWFAFSWVINDYWSCGTLHRWSLFASPMFHLCPITFLHCAWCCQLTTLVFGLDAATRESAVPLAEDYSAFSFNFKNLNIK